MEPFAADAFLRDVLACPACLDSLQLQSDARLPSFLKCAACTSVYPIENGTPQLVDLQTLIRLPKDLLAVWHLTQQRAAPLYESNDAGSCSRRERDDVQAFRRFMSLSGKAVLDIGSGSFALPGYADGTEYYADGRGFTHFVGVDPIPPPEKAPFPFVVSIGERLPFKDEVFDAVILATSLDHALDVETTLFEVHRVLRPHGDVYVWAMFIENEDLLGSRRATPIATRSREHSSTAKDPVGAYLSARDQYDKITQQIDGEFQRFDAEFVDEYHFRHFDREGLLEALSHGGFWLANEETFKSAAGDTHSFLRLVKASPEQAIAQTLSRLREEVRESRLELDLALTRLQNELDRVAANLADLREMPQRTVFGRAKRKWRRARLAAQHLPGVTPWLVRAAMVSRDRVTPPGDRVLMLTIGGIDHDPRPNKVARSLADDGYRVEIIAPSVDDNSSEYDVSPSVRYVRVARHSPISLFVVYQEEFLHTALSRGFDYVHANDLTTLTVGWILAQIRRVPLIYDAHELWTENVELSGQVWVPMSPRTRAIAGRWEAFLLRYVDLLVTVGPSIVAEYERRGGLKRRPLLLANYPSLSLLRLERPVVSIHEACGLTERHFVTLYMGGVGPLRNIESVIQAHRHLPENHVFVVMGPGVEVFGDEYRAVAQQAGVSQRVFFLPPVGMHEVVAAASDADCGIVMLQNICKNFYFFYPNKLFEYALAGLPIAASNFPDVASFIQSARCGVTFDPESPTSIASALLSLSTDLDEARSMGARGRASILERHNWEAAVEGLVAAYRDIGR